MILLDCNAVCYRAHYTTKHLESSDGTPTGIIYGFFSQLKTIVEQVGDPKLVFCWDSNESKRKKMYKPYKANRNKKRNEDPSIFNSFMQFDELRTQILPALGIQNNFMYEGYEADDIIAKICKAFRRDIVIASNDQDLYQCLNEEISIYKLAAATFYTVNNFYAEFGGISPLQWADVKAIVGCSSDNIAGIRGVGVKTAVKWLHDESMFNAKIECPAGDKIMQRNYPLVELPLAGTPMPDIKFTELDYDKWKEFCHKYELQSFLKDRFWYDLFALRAPLGYYQAPTVKRGGKRA